MSFISRHVKRLGSRPRAVRVAPLGLLTLLSLLVMVIRLTGPWTGGGAGPGPAPLEIDFPLEGWRYGTIGEAPEGGRYRLRVSVRLRAEEARRIVGSMKSDGTTSNPMTSNPAAATAGPSPEFRLLLERTGEGDFTCLRCLDGVLELVRVAGGEPVESAGKSRTSLAFLSEFVQLESDPVTLEFHVDRSPGRWAVGLFGDELLTIPEGRPPRPGRAGEFAWSATPGWTLAAKSLQPVGEIAFEDAFERESFGDESAYDLLSGEWKLDSVRDVTRSTNAFRLRGKGKGKTPALATVGHDFWRDYRVEVSVRFPGPGTGGLVFAARRGQKLGVLRWRCLPPQQPSPEGTDARGRALLEVLEAAPFGPPALLRQGYGGHGRARPSAAGYTERVIVSLPWRPRPEQWYRLAVSIFEETGELEVNGRRARFRLPRGLRSGACGLYSESPKGVLFDDLSVRSNAGFVHTRGDLVGHLAEPNEGWARLLGLPDGPARLRVRPARGARSLSLRWPDEKGNDVRLSLLGSWGRGTLEMEPEGAGLRRAEAGPPVRPGGRASAAQAGGIIGLGDFRIRPDLLEREVTVEIAEDLCTVLDGRSVAGRARLPCRRAGPVRIAQAVECHGGTPLGAGPTGPNYLAAGPLVPRAPIRRKSPAFEEVDVTVNRKGEKYARSRYGGFVGWIEDRGAWDVSGGAARFRAPVWGDVDCELGPVHAKGGGDDGKKRVGLYLVPLDNEKRALGVSLVRESDGVAATDRRGRVLRRYYDDGDSPPPARRIRLRRIGEAVEASVDGETVFRARLNKRAAVRVEARGPGVGPDDLTIRAASIDESLFEKAPTEWIRWRGHWDLTDKWACDMRWSFLGLWSDAADTAHEAAGLFSRASYHGDQHLHFNLAFKDMLAGKVHKRRYVRRDLNFAFSCEGEDLASGYCLLLGGFGNRGTQLLRNGELVAENKKLKFPKFTGGVGDLHWNWYSLVITRRGGNITVTMNGRTVIEWRDPEPLGGGHVAAWVLGGGMILGRTRFSAERRGADLAGFETEASGVAPPEGWRPLDADHPVAIERSYLGAARVTNRSGGGHFAAEFRPPSEGKDAGPRALAFRAGESTRVRARLYLSGKKGPAAVLPKGDGTLPADGEWHVFELDKSLGGPKRGIERVRLGSWDAEGYLAAGIGGNPAGAWYEVMLFPKLDAATRFCRRSASEDAF